MMGVINLNNLGIVKVGDAFVWKTETQVPDSKQKFPFEGKSLTVVGFMPASYKNRVVLKDPDGSEVLMPLEMVEKALTSQQLPKGTSNPFSEGGQDALSGKPEPPPP